MHFISSSSLLRWSDLGIGPHPQPCSELGQAMGGGKHPNVIPHPPPRPPEKGLFSLSPAFLLEAGAGQNRNPQRSQPASLLQSHKLQSSGRL